MVKFLIKILPFLILFLLNISLRFWVKYDPRYNFFIYNDVNKFRNETIIIGDSKTLSGINDDAFNKMATSIVNLSSWGAQPFDLLKGIDKYDIKNCTILINVTSRIFFQPDTTFADNSPNNIKRIFNFKLELSDFNEGKRGRWEYKTQKSGSITFLNITRPYSSYNWKKDSTKCSSSINDSNTEKYTNIKIKHFTSLVKKLRANNQIILIDLPERKDYDKIIRKYEDEIFQRIFDRTGIKIIDFGIYPNSLFYDSHHLNKIGQKIFSYELLKIITASKSKHTH
jgi:hypothetical protein